MNDSGGRARVARLSVVIPAHDEAATLPRLLAGLRDDELEVVVVCNGCTDDTATVARAAAPGARVIEIEPASKVAALAAGDAAAKVFPRFYVDADVQVSDQVLRLLAAQLGAGTDAVAPAVQYDTSRSSWPVRAYYRVLPLLPAVATSIAGTGCIGLTESGRGRFSQWPGVLADDYFVDGLFRPGEKERVREATSRVVAPRSLTDLVRRRVRVIWANREVDSLGLRRAPVVRAGGVGQVLRSHPARLADVLIFVGVSLWVRARLRVTRGPVAWGRDDSRERVG